MKADNLTFQEVLDKGFFVIPRFQRDYSWGNDEISELWHDAFEGNDTELFIGSFVAYQTGQPRQMGLVDGQQRLTTLTILLCCIRDAFSRIGEANYADGLQTTYIQRPTRHNERRYILEIDQGSTFLQEKIQSWPRPRNTPPSSKLEKRIADAYKWLSDHVSKREESTGTSKKSRKAQLNALTESLLNLRTVFILTDNEDESIKIFETLNSRGKDLQLSDLLKAHILKNLPAEAETTDSTKETWRSYLDFAEEWEVPFDTFLHHAWNSRFPYTSKAKMYSAVRRTVSGQPKRSTQSKHPTITTEAYLHSLDRDLDYYADILHADGRLVQQKDPQRAVQRALEALNLFSVSQPSPLLIAAFRSYEEGVLRPSNFASLLKAIEGYHFITTAILSRSSTGGLSMMYASAARELSAARSPIAATKATGSLVKKLKTGAKKHMSDFVAALGSMEFSPEKRSEWRLAKYIMSYISQHEAPPSIILDTDNLTIEHISPQHPKGGEKAAPEASLIGNFLLVSGDFNAMLGNLSFKEKKTLLRKGGAHLPKIVSRAASWTSVTIRRQSQKRAETAFTKIWGPANWKIQ